VATLKDMKPNVPYLFVISTFHPLSEPGIQARQGERAADAKNLLYDLEVIATQSSNIEIQRVGPVL
jgi:hypothetical protein